MTPPTDFSEKRGPIAWMVHNPVAANLLMVLLLVGGWLSLQSIKQEVFPDFERDVVSISISYPGASPEEVERGIVLAVEEAVRGVDGVKEVASRAREGYGLVRVEMLTGAPEGLSGCAAGSEPHHDTAGRGRGTSDCIGGAQANGN